MPLADLLEKNGFSCQIETSGIMKYAAHRIPGLPYHQNKYAGMEVLSAWGKTSESNAVGRVRDIEALDGCWRRDRVVVR